jgi:hypothetical protein
MALDELILIERLEEYRKELGGDAEVRLMTRQHWPFENTGLVSGAEINAIRDGEDQDVDTNLVVFIVEGRQRCYGSSRAWEVAH